MLETIYYLYFIGAGALYEFIKNTEDKFAAAWIIFQKSPKKDCWQVSTAHIDDLITAEFDFFIAG